VIRGLEPALYSAEDNLTIFLGLADYIGDIRGIQDRKGNMISTLVLEPLLPPPESISIRFQRLTGLEKPTLPTPNTGESPTPSVTESTPTQAWLVVLSRSWKYVEVVNQCLAFP